MQVIIVLGCSIVFNSNRREYIPSQMLKMRLDQAIQLYIQLYSYDLIIIVSGRRGSEQDNVLDEKGHEITESSVMKHYLIEQGVPECRIFEEKKSQNTVENCLLTYQLLLELESGLTAYDLNCNAEIESYKPPGSIEHVYIVTSDFHLPRTEKIFTHFLKYNWNLHFIAAFTPDNLRRQAWENEARIDVDQWLTNCTRQIN